MWAIQALQAAAQYIDQWRYQPDHMPRAPLASMAIYLIVVYGLQAVVRMERARRSAVGNAAPVVPQRVLGFVMGVHNFVLMWMSLIMFAGLAYSVPICIYERGLGNTLCTETGGKMGQV